LTNQACLLTVFLFRRCIPLPDLLLIFSKFAYIDGSWFARFRHAVIRFLFSSFFFSFRFGPFAPPLPQGFWPGAFCVVFHYMAHAPPAFSDSVATRHTLLFVVLSLPSFSEGHSKRKENLTADILSARTCTLFFDFTRLPRGMGTAMWSHGVRGGAQEALMARIVSKPSFTLSSASRANTRFSYRLCNKKKRCRQIHH